MSDPVHRFVAFDIWDPVTPTNYFNWPPADPDVNRELRLLNAQLSQEPQHSQYQSYGERGQRSHKMSVSNQFTVSFKIVSQTSQEARSVTYESYLRPFNNVGIVRVRYRTDGSNVVPSTTNPVRVFDWDINTFNPQGGEANTDWDVTNAAPVDGSVEYVTTLPTAPTGGSATAAAGPQITVAWTASTEAWTEKAGLRVRGYRVLRGTATGVYTHQIIDTAGVVTAVPYASATADAPDTLALSTEGVSIVDGTTAALTQYFYVVEAIDDYNYISLPSTEVDATTP